MNFMQTAIATVGRFLNAAMKSMFGDDETASNQHETGQSLAQFMIQSHTYTQYADSKLEIGCFMIKSLDC